MGFTFADLPSHDDIGLFPLGNWKAEKGNPVLRIVRSQPVCDGTAFRFRPAESSTHRVRVPV